jgi:hypothetical protein
MQRAEGLLAPSQAATSVYSWNKSRSAWQVHAEKMTLVHGPPRSHSLSQQFIGLYESEEDAATAYDCAAVQLRDLYVKRNFPDDSHMWDDDWEWSSSKNQFDEDCERLGVTRETLGLRAIPDRHYASYDSD